MALGLRSQNILKSSKLSQLRSWKRWLIISAWKDVNCSFNHWFYCDTRPSLPIGPQAPGDDQGRNEHCPSELLSWLTSGRYRVCVSVSRRAQTHTFDHHHTLISCLPFCLSVPQWNHQKHPRGSGDDNHWPLILSLHCHRLGYEGSGDPNRISQRGKHMMLQLSGSLTLTNQLDAVRCKKYCLRDLKWYVSLFLWLCSFFT